MMESPSCHYCRESPRTRSHGPQHVQHDQHRRKFHSSPQEGMPRSNTRQHEVKSHRGRRSEQDSWRHPSPSCEQHWESPKGQGRGQGHGRYEDYHKQRTYEEEHAYLPQCSGHHSYHGGQSSFPNCSNYQNPRTCQDCYPNSGGQTFYDSRNQSSYHGSWEPPCSCCHGDAIHQGHNGHTYHSGHPTPQGQGQRSRSNSPGRTLTFEYDDWELELVYQEPYPHPLDLIPIPYHHPGAPIAPYPDLHSYRPRSLLWQPQDFHSPHYHTPYSPYGTIWPGSLRRTSTFDPYRTFNPLLLKTENASVIQPYASEKSKEDKVRVKSVQDGLIDYFEIDKDDLVNHFSWLFLRELTSQSCEWFYGNIKQKFKRFGSAKVVRSLYKRKSECKY